MQWLKDLLCWLGLHPVGDPYDGDKYTKDWKPVGFADWECTCPNCKKKVEWP